MGFLTIDSLGLHCELSDRLHAADSVPLLLLHGAGGSGRHWRWLVQELPAWVAPIVVDLPGHGASPGPVPDSLDAAVERVEALLAGVALDGPLGVAGHSMGGMVALRLALASPATVSHLALVATAATIRPHPQLLEQLRGDSLDEAFIRDAFTEGVPEERVRLVIEDLGRTRLAHGAEDFMDVTGHDLHPRLASLTMPALVLIARGDPVISPRRSRALAAGLPDARSVALDGGHYLHIERPGDVAAELAALLRSAPARRVTERVGNGGTQ